jgi:hypothetical protein
MLDLVGLYCSVFYREGGIIFNFKEGSEMKKKIIRKVKGGLFQPEFISYPASHPAVDVEPVIAAVKNRGGYKLSRVVFENLTLGLSA